MSNRDKCRFTNDRQWMHCNECGKRKHLPDCTTRKQPEKDCCPANHTPEKLAAYAEELRRINDPTYHIANAPLTPYGEQLAKNERQQGA